MIRILTGPVQSYKTTSLHAWVAGREDVGGVLSPDVDGLRRLHNIRDRVSIPWQKPEVTNPGDLEIGRFVFDQNAFKNALDWMDRDLADPKLPYFVLDEIGPLELNGKGWDTWLKRSLEKLHTRETILVVRDFLVDQVKLHYDLQNATLITREDL